MAQGRDPAVLRQLLSGIAPDDSIVTLDQQQPEFVSPVWDYVNNRFTDRRIAAGIQMKATLGATLTQIEQRYGVDSDIVLGIWALESNFGQAPLNYTAPEALATLAFEGRRRAQFENYLLALCQMVERGLATADQLRSSWAGALGQPQFMPDVYLSLAVDWDGDGKRDIWSDNADVAASISNYLQNRGWQAGQPVFDEVRLPSGFNFGLADGSTRSVSDWEGIGVRRIDGSPWTASDRILQSQLFLPAGASGPALLLHPNFAVIRRYNNSDRYALVVALLARAFEGRGGLVAPWPQQIGSLNRDQTLELQTLLNSLGYNAGTPDGLFGSGTRRAVRAFQTDQHLAADGFPTTDLLSRVRTRAGVSVDPPPAAPRALDTTRRARIAAFAEAAGLSHWPRRRDPWRCDPHRDPLVSAPPSHGCHRPRHQRRARRRARGVALRRGRLHGGRRDHDIAQASADQRKGHHAEDESNGDDERGGHAEMFVGDAAQHG